MGNKCFGDIILSFGDFKAILQDFSDCVEAKMYSKMEYNMWRKLVKYRPEESAVLPMMMMTQGNVDPTMAMVMMAMGQGNGKMDMSSMMPLMWVMQNSKPVAPVVNHTCGGNCNGNCGHHEG